MKYSALALSTILAGAYARPEANIAGRAHARDLHVVRHAYVSPVWNAQLQRREVPQEHAHEKFLTKTGEMLNLNNPDEIKDTVFGLLGNAAGAAGQGKITNTDCLQQATADQAFTNAKAAGDVDGMTSALIYRALERNTGKVGLASVACTAIKAVNPEIAAIAQHQDPASQGAAQINKNIALNLAMQIQCIGGDATLALQSGTFAPGQLGDPTAKGNSCDDQNDAEGCIFTQNLLVEDATVDEIQAAVAGAACAGGAAAAVPAVSTVPGVQTNTAVASAANTVIASTPPAAAQPTECSLATATVTVTANQGAASPPPIGNDQAASPPTNQNQGMNAAPPPAIGDGAMLTATSPNPMITALPNTANNAAQDCSAQIASALAAAGFAGSSSDAAAATTVAAAPPAATTTAAASGAAAGSALDFGSCPNPTIVFGPGFDGRKENSFEPADTPAFTHGSALNIKVITDFICQQLQTKCGASAATLAACASGASAAQAAGGKSQAASDAFNAALGF